MAIDPIKGLRRKERADLRRQARQDARDRAAVLRAERMERRRAAWPRWTAWWEKRARELKIAATVVGSAGVIATGAVATVKKAGAIWHATKRAWSFYADRGVGPPDRPRGSDVASLATDRFEREHPPDAGTTR